MEFFSTNWTICFKLLSNRSKKWQMQFSFCHKTAAPGEARTHGLQIMRLTRCLLRYGGYVRDMDKNYPGGGLEPPIFGLGDRRLIH